MDAIPFTAPPQVPLRLHEVLKCPLSPRKAGFFHAQTARSVDLRPAHEPPTNRPQAVDQRGQLADRGQPGARRRPGRPGRGECAAGPQGCPAGPAAASAPGRPTRRPGRSLRPGRGHARGAARWPRCGRTPAARWRRAGPGDLPAKPLQLNSPACAIIAPTTKRRRFQSEHAEPGGAPTQPQPQPQSPPRSHPEPVRRQPLLHPPRPPHLPLLHRLPHLPRCWSGRSCRA